MAIGNKPDVIVVGAGIFGLACAYACAKRRLKVLVIDAEDLGTGASGGIVGAMAPHTPDQWNPKKQFQFEALDSAENFWREVDSQSGHSSGYGRVGRVIPIVSEKDLILAEARIEASRENWLEAYRWKIIDDAPHVSKSAAPFGLIEETLSARIYPRRAVRSLAAACAKLGVVFQMHTRVTAIDDHMVTTTSGEQKAAAVILAAGYHGFHLMDFHLGAGSGTGVKGQAARLDVDLGGHPQIYADNIYVIPHADGTTAIGSTSENSWGQPFETDEQLDRIIDQACNICPSLAGAEVIERWAGLRPKARRRDPMIGSMPGLSGMYVATGAFKIGFGIAHKVGDVVAAEILGEHPVIPDSFTVSHHLA